MKLIKKILSVAVAMLSCAICAVGVSSVTVKADQTVDITQNVSASGWISQSELRVTYLNVGTGVIPGGVGYGIIDKDNYTYVQDYVAINGKTIKEINTEELPIVLLGDFNTDEDDAIFNGILGYGFQSCRLKAAVGDSYKTHNNFTPSGQLRIDHIFHKGFSSVQMFTTDRTKYEGITCISDHYPVWTIVKF